jgi:dienelactone hydrolase
MRSLLPLSLAVLFSAGCGSLTKTARNTGPWDMAALNQVPLTQWGSRTGLVQEVYYQGEPYEGSPTRVFAYVGRPASGRGPFPAMVLVYGGGGKAFREWAEHWARRGYVALAMDTAGCGPEGRLPDGGPDQNDAAKFRNFTDAQAHDMWTYHAVAAVIRGHSLLASLPEVDRQRIGIAGISWGGYLTCIVAGLDHRLKVAVPVYGCGFLGENSAWKAGSLAKMNPEARERWLRYFDPSQYLGGVNCPILFLNGANDFAYPLDSYRASYRLVRASLRHVSVVLNLPHGHIWTFEEVDQFVDSLLSGGTPLPRLGPMRVRDSTVEVRAHSRTALKEAALNYTLESGEWQKRKWVTVPAQVEGKLIIAPMPEPLPATWFVSAVDERGLRVSTEHEDIPVSKAR